MGTHPIFESDFDCLTEWLTHYRKRFLLLVPREPLLVHSVVPSTDTLPMTCKLLLMLLPSNQPTLTQPLLTLPALVTLCNHLPMLPISLDMPLSVLVVTFQSLPLLLTVFVVQVLKLLPKSPLKLNLERLPLVLPAVLRACHRHHILFVALDSELDSELI